MRRHSAPAVVLTREPNAVVVRLDGLVTSAERRTRRWRWLAELCLVLSAMAMLLAATAYTLSVAPELRRRLAVLSHEVQEARREAACWRVVSPHAGVQAKEREERVRVCVDQERRAGR